MSRTFLVNGLTFHFEDDTPTSERPNAITFQVMSSWVSIAASITAEQADAIGSVFKAVAKTRGFKEKNTT